MFTPKSSAESRLRARSLRAAGSRQSSCAVQTSTASAQMEKTFSANMSSDKPAPDVPELQRACRYCRGHIRRRGKEHEGDERYKQYPAHPPAPRWHKLGESGEGGQDRPAGRRGNRIAVETEVGSPELGKQTRKIAAAHAGEHSKRCQSQRIYCAAPVGHLRQVHIGLHVKGDEQAERHEPRGQRRTGHDRHPTSSSE